MPKLAGENNSFYFIPRGFGLKSAIGDSGFFDRHIAINALPTAFKSVTFEKLLDAAPQSKSCSMIETWPNSPHLPFRKNPSAYVSGRLLQLLL
jgi:hypothetical protein